jgi:UDP-N-acetylglucosamine--N-acetylmuramyl-(pentapeptide) pyrophosphoryl-undecaprenol N-acetylglucosamine transferase
MKVIISGGGTGGHIFPAIAIADAIKKISPEAEILFVGANGRMEMEKVPSAGYKIIGLDIAGLQRKLSVKNLYLPFKVLKSLMQARSVIKEFKPDVAIGVGGYASGPLLKVCSWMKVPYVIQEQNSYAGITNKLLGKNAKKIFVAYKGMDKFFETSKIEFTGNPIRNAIAENNITTAEAKAKFGFDTNKKTTLIFGGSLGARTLNEAVAFNEDFINSHGELQFIWQVGKLYYDEYSKSKVVKNPNVKVLPFIEDMSTAYKAADIVVCRAGALTISELALIGKASILVPSPNVAEDHQTHNAMALVNENAALLVKDNEVKQKLFPTILELINNMEKVETIEKNVKKFGKSNASEVIARNIIDIVKNKIKS